MKSFLLSALFAFLLQTASAANYYFSTTGDDSRSNDQAQSPSTPWKSISKLNAIFKTLKAGDSILFKRGETFYGSILISTSGTSGAPIVISTYGSGAKPIISGLTKVSNWVSLGGGVYESSDSVSSLATANMVVKGDKVQPLGRFPNVNADNGGYRIFESFSGKTSITDNDGGLANWAGGEVVVRSIQHLLDRATIISNTSTTINNSGTSSAPHSAGYGYFIQNHPNTLDQVGEWYYNPNTKKLRMYSGGTNPGTVGISSVEFGAAMVGRSYITFDGLSFEGANAFGFKVHNSHFITINNCDILYSGQDGISSLASTYAEITNNLVEWSNDSGIRLLWAGQTANSNSTIRGNMVRNTGMFAGMGKSGEVKYMGIAVYGSGNVVEYNTVENTGYCPIYFVYGSNILIKNNFINKFCITKNDGGAIYTWNKPPTPSVYTGSKITGNIIMNGVGVSQGTPSNSSSTHGIYFDNNTANIEVSGNTVTNVDYGLFNYNAYNNNIHHNTFYNNRMRQLDLNHSLADQPLVRNITVKHNIMVAKTSTQFTAIFRTIGTDIAQFGTIDSNYYARPLNENGSIKVIIHQFHQGATQISKNYDLEAWKLLYGKDKASKRSPKTFPVTINPDDSIRFEFNPTQSNKTITLDGNYIDVKNQQYTNSIELAPYTSIVLLKDRNTEVLKTNVAPTVSITSPVLNASYEATASVQLTATADDADGTISKVEFYNGSTLLKTITAAPFDWTWTNVSEGAYSLTANATDNSGSVATSKTVSIIVNKKVIEVTPVTPVAPEAPVVPVAPVTPETPATPVIPVTPSQSPVVSITSPKVNATIAAPASVTLTATATDADGTISKVEFFNGSTLITTEKSAPYDWTWTNAPAGVYNLTAKATDNNGNVTTSSIVTFTVKGNAAPTVSITSPKVNANYTGTSASVRLTATATDADGKVANVKFYNGTTLIITESTAPYDWTWKGVKPGTYKITAKATDNSGNVTTSEVITFTVGSSNARLMVQTNNASTKEEVMIGKETTKPSSVTMRLYPNPSTNKIYLENVASQNGENVQLMIRTISGTTVKSMMVNAKANVIEADISNLSAGMYILTLSGKNVMESKTFIKN